MSSFALAANAVKANGANRVTPEKGRNQNFRTLLRQEVVMFGLPYAEHPISSQNHQSFDVRKYCEKNTSSFYSSSSVTPHVTPANDAAAATDDDDATAAAQLKRQVSEQQRQLQEMAKALNEANAKNQRLAQELQYNQTKDNLAFYDYIEFTLRNGASLFPSEIIKDNEGAVCNYIIGVTMGTGIYGKVVQAWHLKTHAPVALKIVEAENLFQQSEIRAMRRINHPNIIKLHDDVVDEAKNKCGLALELCEMDLYTYNKKHGGLSLEDLRQISLALSKALKYLHSQSICHLDVKPENILITRECPNRECPLRQRSSLCQHRIKLGDFGLATMADVPHQEPVCERRMRGTRNYFAPEMAGSQRYNAAAADMWSAGATLLALHLSTQAWVDAYQTYDEDDTDHTHFKMGLRNFLRHLNRVSSTTPTLDLICRLLKETPTERLTAEGALQLEWLQE